MAGTGPTPKVGLSGRGAPRKGVLRGPSSGERRVEGCGRGSVFRRLISKEVGRTKHTGRDSRPESNRGARWVGGLRTERDSSSGPLHRRRKRSAALASRTLVQCPLSATPGAAPAPPLSRALCKRRSKTPSLKRPGLSGCAGVKVRQQIALCGWQRAGDEGRGAVRAGSLCGAD